MKHAIMDNVAISPVAVAAVGTLLLLLLLPNNHVSYALSSTNFRSPPNGNSPQYRHGALPSSARRNRVPCTALFARQRHPSSPLRAVAQNTIATDTPWSKADNATDIPISPASSPGLTVIAGPGARITSVSRGVAVEQEFWETKFDQGEFVRAFTPPFDRKEAGDGNAGSHGKTERTIVDYHAVVQDSWETKFDQGEFVRPSPLSGHSHSVAYGRDEKVTVDYDLFPDEEIFHGGDIPISNAFMVMDISNEGEDKITEDIDSTTDEPDETSGSDENGDDRENPNTHEAGEDDSVISSAMAKSALLHRAGITGTAKRPSRRNGRSSRAKTHVNKSRSGSSGGAMQRVLGTVRTAAAAAASQEQKRLLDKDGTEPNPGENVVTKDNLTTNNSPLATDPPSSNFKKAVESVVTEILQTQDAAIQQQSLGNGPPHGQSAMNSPPPPGTASMGLLGEVVQEKIPAIPPLPGKLLVPSNQDIRPTPKRQVSVRSSIPHSSDDTHIANLRLSVFSRFDEEQQRLFRSRSVEVLNIRRRRGAVVLVAEEAASSNRAGKAQQHRYLTEMQARIESGHVYGDEKVARTGVDAREPSSHSFTVTPMRGAKITRVSSAAAVDSPSLTVTPVRGAKITSVSSGVAVDSPSLTVTARGAKITSASSGVVVENESNLEIATIGKNHGDYSRQNTDKGPIIGSVECSHQEFRGTILGNSRPKRSLMYVTEVAVRPDARRCGAGAMLMRGVDEVASLRNIETVYLHVDVANRAACSMYEKCGYHYLDKREPIYAQFTASLNLHDGAMHGRKHYLMCKNRVSKTTWIEDDLFLETEEARWDC